MKKQYPYWVQLASVIAISIFTSLLLPHLLILTWMHVQSNSEPVLLNTQQIPLVGNSNSTHQKNIPILPDGIPMVDSVSQNIPFDELPQELKDKQFTFELAPYVPENVKGPIWGKSVLTLSIWQMLAIYLPVVIVFSIAIGYWWGKRLSKPLQKLVDFTLALRNGDRSTLILNQGPREILQLADSINELNIELQESERQRQNFMVDICHDFRTPITVLNGNIQAIADGIYPLHMDEILILHAQVKMLNRLVNDVQFLGLFETKQFQLNFKEISLNQLLKDVYLAFKLETKQKEIPFSLSLPSEDCRFLGDEERLKQVLYNLLSNSLKNSTAQQEIHLRLESNEEIQIYVQDEGEGIDPSELARIKERFYRTQEARADRKEGLGLGLAISHYLVKAHGGELILHSKGKGQGVRAEIRLLQSVSNQIASN